MTDERLLLGVARTLSDVLRPLQDSLSSGETFAALLLEQGWRPPDVDGYLSNLEGAFGVLVDLPTIIEKVEQLSRVTSPSPTEVEGVLGIALTLIDRFRAFSVPPPVAAGLPAPLNSQEFWEKFPVDLANRLFADYLEAAYPSIYGPLHVLGVIDEVLETADQRPFRVPFRRIDTRWDRLPLLVQDPRALVRDLYGWGSQLDHAKLLGRLERALLAFGLDAGQHPPHHRLLEAYYPNGVPPDVRELRARLFVLRDLESGYAELGLAALPIPARTTANGNPTGLLVTPYGNAELQGDLPIGGPFLLRLKGGFDLDSPFGIELRPDGVGGRLAADSISYEMGAEFAAVPNRPYILLGYPDSHRVELSDFALGLELFGEENDLELSLTARVNKLELVLDFGQADGFLALVSGGESRRFSAAGALQWSSKRGVTFEGRAGLSMLLSVNLRLGLVDVHSLLVDVAAGSGQLALTLAVSGALRLGPISATIDNVGLRAAALPRDPQEPPGMFGHLDLALAFKPPDGVGLSIDAGAVTGAGFLFFDPVKEQYAGALHLQVEGGLTLNAFGLLTTRMPDRSPGFSLLILVQASGFAPVPLGFGFTLTGVGGLLGVNRTVDVEVLRAGIRSRVLDSILFCNDDPAPRAAQIVSTLNSVFPPARDRYVFGPMVQLEWGTPALVTIEVALILELPSPLRLIVLGRLHALLPVADAPIVTLHLDAVGVLDFGRREASVDATLYDSFVGPYSLSGDMALRVSWGDQPEFALAVGGFHPAFKPPAGFPALRRLTLVLATGDNPRVRAEAYLAVTANTIQLGARLELRAEASGFVLEGGMGFDTLLTRVPFGFEVDIAAYLALKRGGSTIMGIDLRATLAGPNPWHLRGSVSFSILFLSVTIPIDATFGDTRQLPEVQQKPVWPELKQALEAPGNWAAELPADAGRLAVLSPTPAGVGEVVVHPLGAVRVLQRVVPLERTIARFGAAPPQDFSRFSISEVIGAHRDSVVYDSFAPAQFLEMTDADKLSAPGFERMPAGVGLRAPENASAFGSAASRPLRYETITIGGPAAGTRFEPDAATIAQQAERGAAAGAATRTTGRAKFSVETPPPRVAEPAFDVTDVTQLSPKPDVTDGTYSAALEAAGLHRDVQVVRRAELAVP